MNNFIDIIFDTTIRLTSYFKLFFEKYGLRSLCDKSCQNN